MMMVTTENAPISVIPTTAQDRKKPAIKLTPIFIKPMYMCPAPGIRENANNQNLLYFLFISSILTI